MFAMLASLPLLAAAATAAKGMQVNLCAVMAPLASAYFLQDGYVAPPEASRMMIDVSAGRSDQINQDVQEVKRVSPAKDAQRWLNLALFTAVTTNRADIAERLIGLGADVNSRPSYPPFTHDGMVMARFEWQMEALRAQSYEKATESQIKAWEPFPPTLPMLEQAAMCSHIPALKVLLAHGADMYPHHNKKQAGNKYGILVGAIINRNEDSVNVLLDHGYDPCKDFQIGPNPKHQTDVTLAKRMGLSAPLQQRITALSTKCPAPARLSSTH